MENSKNDLVVEKPSTLVRCKSVIGTSNNSTSINFVVLSIGQSILSPEIREGTFSMTIVHNNRGYWTAEKLLEGITHEEITMSTGKEMIVFSRNNQAFVFWDRSTPGCMKGIPSNSPCRVGPCAVGFDAKIEKYKLVQLLDCGLSEVLTLDDKYPQCPRWRAIEIDVLEPCCYKKDVLLVQNPVYVNGSIYWSVTVHRGNHLGVLCFNVETEKFEVFGEVPKKVIYGRSDEKMVSVSLAALKGCVCMAKHDKKEKTVEIWMLKDSYYGDWVREYKVEVSPISYCDFDIVPVCIHNQKIYFQALSYGLVSYDMMDKRFTTIYACQSTGHLQVVFTGDNRITGLID